MERAGDVIVVGSINVDFVVRAARLPQAGETVTGGTFERHFGGKGANQAVAAARLDAAVSLVGATGDDELADTSLAALRDEGVDVSRVTRLKGATTGAALIVVDQAGENQIAVASGANGELTWEMVASTLADWQPGGRRGVLLGVFEVGDDAIGAGALFAIEHGLTLVVNPAPARALPETLVEAHAIIVANEGEARTLTGRTDPLLAVRAMSVHTGAPAIVTLGAAGALVAVGDTVATIGAPRVEAVDTTGAGDTFVGALAAELARGASVVDAARFAVAAAALSVTAPGARGGMPRRAEVTAVLLGVD